MKGGFVKKLLSEALFRFKVLTLFYHCDVINSQHSIENFLGQKLHQKVAEKN